MRAISPDGAQVVYVANQRLYLRSMADTNARPLPGTETFNAATSPVFSPDGRSIVFWTSADSASGNGAYPDRLTSVPSLA